MVPRADSPASTLGLLHQARAGDRDALNALLDRCMPRLRRWAHGRLPDSARAAADTADVVQDAVMRSLARLERIDFENEGAFHAYLREAVLNRIRDEIRTSGRRPAGQPVDSAIPDEATSPLEAAIGAQALDRYEAALRQLKPDERDMVIARLEMGMSYEEVAAAFDRPSANAARMAVARAISRLAGRMRHER